MMSDIKMYVELAEIVGKISFLSSEVVKEENLHISHIKVTAGKVKWYSVFERLCCLCAIAVVQYHAHLACSSLECSS